MSNDRILLIEDDLGMQMIVQSVVSQLCALTCVGTIADAERALNAEPYSLVILDVMLPDGDGFSFCKALKANPRWSEIPVIFLTGENEVDQKVLGFSLGADDYIVKPLEPKEFVARLESKLKRKPQGQLQTTFCKSDFRVDLTGQKIYRLCADKVERELGLTPIEFKLLVHFLRHESKIVTREELVVTVWGDTVHVAGHTVDTHVSSLRKKISESGYLLKAVIKKGYCFSLAHKPMA